MKPLCFVLMPFGAKKDPHTGIEIDFDTIYDTAIRPGIADAGLEPIRADEERTGGIIHQAMFERLMLCDFAVADLTTANANVFYELGVRHAVRPSTTVAVYAEGQSLPFDLAFLRALSYELGSGAHFGSDEAAALREGLAKRLEALRVGEPSADSPIFQLVEGYPAPEISRLRTDLFRERTRYSADVKNALARARSAGDVTAIGAIQQGLGDLADVEAGVLIDLYLTHRAVGSFEKMVELEAAMPRHLAGTLLVQEQLGFALNRLGRRDEALRVLEGVLARHGDSSETCGLIGRIYKDLYLEAEEAGEGFRARGHLERAIRFYTRGYETDMRDAYPGVNAVTLLELEGSEASARAQAELLPVVRYAVNRRLASTRPDYWDHATLLELAVLARDRDVAYEHLADALAHVRESWEPETTRNNLVLIARKRTERGEPCDWLEVVLDELARASK